MASSRVSRPARAVGSLHNGPMTTTLEAVEWPVRTSRLLLRRATVADVESTWSYRRMDAVNRWLPSAATEVDDYRPRFESPGRLGKTLVIEHDNTVVGDLMLAVEDAWAQAEVEEAAKGVQAELGWSLAPAYGGQGLATEAVRALIAIAFDELRLRRVIAHCFADNEASWRLMERVGMRREAHTVRDTLHRSGQWLDGLSYALLAEEWRTTEPG
jgi:RimJ/RimL family protein N-acetyltransferase